MKKIDLCAFYITARSPGADLNESSELRKCYECRGFDIHCEKQLLTKIDRLEYERLQGVKKRSYRARE
ncbi:MAG: hypothetical protein WC979_04790 [Candidatus Pacearchaeota archaeon]|jgi:hypothetical protein